MSRMQVLFRWCIAVLSLIVISACAGGGGSAPGNTQATQPPAAKATEAPKAATAAAPAAGSEVKFDGTILLGAAVSISGKTSNEGKYTRDGYDLYINLVNQKGGVQVGNKRYKLELKVYDDESAADTSAKLTEKLVTEDKVNFLLGPYGSAPTFSASAIAEKYEIPMVEANGAAESIFSRGFKYTFAVLTPGKQYLKGIVDLVLAKDPTVKKLAILVENDPFSIEVAEGARDYAKSKGMDVVYFEKYPSGTQDISSLLTAVKGLAPDMILGAGHLQDTLLIVKQGKDIGVNAKAWGFSVGPTTPEFRDALKKDADYIFGGSQWTPALKYKGDDLIVTPDAYAKMFKELYKYDPPYQSAESSAAILAYVKAIQAAGSLDPKAVRDALAKLDIMTFYGQIKFDERGINTYKPMAVEQLQTDGKRYTVYPSDVAEKDAMYPTPAWNQR